MARSKRRERKRAGSHKRDQQQKSGGSFTCIKVPSGLPLFKPEDKRYKLDVINYEVGDGNGGNPCADPGEWYYERTYHVHNGVGPDNKRYVCPAKTAGRPCPICEERARIARDPDGDEAELKALNPSQRQIWLFQDRDDVETGVQMFDFSWWNFGKIVDELRGEADDDEDHVKNFDDPEAGATMVVKFSKNPPYGVVARSIEFRPRSKPLPDELLDHGFCLDDLLIIPDYDELKKLFFLLDDEEGEEKPKPGRKAKDEEDEDPPKKSSRKKKLEPEPDEDDDGPDDEELEELVDKPDEQMIAEEAGIEEGSKVLFEDEPYEVARISKDGTSLTLEDEDGNTVKAVGVDEVELVKEKRKVRPVEDEDEPPKKSTSRKKPVDDEDDDEPPKKSRKSKPKDEDDW